MSTRSLTGVRQAISESLKKHDEKRVKMILGVAGFATIGLVFFGRRLIRWMGRRTANVLTEAVRQERLQNEAYNSVNRFLSDPRSIQLGVDYVKQIIDHPETQDAVQNMAIEIWCSDEVQQALVNKIKETLQAQEMRQETANHLAYGLEQDIVLDTVRDSFMEILQSDEIQATITNLGAGAAWGIPGAMFRGSWT